MTSLRHTRYPAVSFRRGFAVLAAVLVCALALAACERPSEAPVQAGDRLPHFRVTDLDGNALDSTQWLGRFTVLNLWATWCTPCRAEMPALERLNRTRGRDALRVVAVSLDSDPNLVREFVLEYDLTFPIGLDPEGRAVTGVLGTRVLPETWVIDEGGRVLVRIAGIVDWDSPSERERIIPPLTNAETENETRVAQAYAPAGGPAASQPTAVPGHGAWGGPIQQTMRGK